MKPHDKTLDELRELSDALRELRRIFLLRNFPVTSMLTGCEVNR